MITCNEVNCPDEYINDAYYDYGCMHSACNYDSPLHSDNVCMAFTKSDCFYECPYDEVQLTNGICDPECDSSVCGYDLGDCGYCNSGCFEKDLISDVCKPECDTYTCLFLLNSCNLCAPGCSDKDLHSKTCKEECLAKNCLANPKNPCLLSECAPECLYNMRGNSWCDKECYNSNCNYDDGDFYCSLYCADKSGECLTNETYNDPCDNYDCA